MKCPNCSQEFHIVNEGLIFDAGYPKQKYWCVNCGNRWEVEPSHEVIVKLRQDWQ